MKIVDNLMQKNMLSKLNKDMPDSKKEKGILGSICIKSENPEALNWRFAGTSDFDRFIKRYGLEAVDDSGKKAMWTMASRGSEEKSGNVTMIIPIIKDKFGQLWTLLQEEARPIDLFRNGKDSRLFAFPAGIIGDEIANETAQESAVRELTEETGLVAKEITPLTLSRAIPTTPGLTDEATNYFAANIKELKPKTKAMTDGVTKAWWFIPFKNLNKWLLEMEKLGKVSSGQTMTALTLLRQKLKMKI